MKFYAFVFLSVLAYLQAQAQAGPVNTHEKTTEKAAPAPTQKMNHADDVDADDETNDADPESDFENQPHHNEHETTTSNTSHVFNSTSEGKTPNLDAFMKAFEAIDEKVYNEIENFLENVVPKLPENNNPITNHLESAVFLFELYEKMKEPRDLNNSQEQHFLSEIESFLASNSFLLFNKPTAGRQDLDDEFSADQEGEEQNPEFELNDDLPDNNLEESTNDEDTTNKPHAKTEKPTNKPHAETEKSTKKPHAETEKPQKKVAPAA